MQRSRVLLIAATIALSPCVARAQAPVDPRTPQERLTYFTDALDRAFREARAEDRKARLDSLADIQGSQTYAFVFYALSPQALQDSYRDFLQAALKTRVDQQLGSVSAGGRSMTTAAKTGVTDLIGFALEGGAITQTVDQNVATLRANADGLVRFLSNQEIFPVCPPGKAGCADTPLSHVELSAAFSVSDSGSTPVTGTVPGTTTPVSFAAMSTEHQFNSATVRYAVLNERDLRSATTRGQWIAWLTKNPSVLAAAGSDLAGAAQSLFDKAIHVQLPANEPTPVPACQPVTEVYFRWLCETRAAFNAAPSRANLDTLLQQRLDVLLVRMRAADPAFDAKLSELSSAYLRYLSLRRSAVEAAVTAPGLTVDYTYSQLPLTPKLHTFRVSYAMTPNAPASGPVSTGTVTFNGAVEFYQDAQPIGSTAANRWKDAHAALQFDRPFGPVDSPTQFSAGLYFQYQRDPSVIVIPEGATTLPGTTIPLPAAGTPLLGQPGSIIAAQALLTLRLSSSGTRIPIGISWSNRTELVPGNHVTGHVGFTFDSSPLALLGNLR